MGAVGVNTAFCWRKRVRAEGAKLQWPGEECERSWGFCLGRADTGRAALGRPAPSWAAHTFAERQHVSTPSPVKGRGATAVSPAAHMLLSKMVPHGLAPPLSLHPSSWGSPMRVLRDWTPFVVLKPLPPGWQSWNTFFLFSPSAIPGPGLCLSECHEILSKLLSGLWRCHKYKAIFPMDRS